MWSWEMIVCHERKLIFVKSKKVGGTSFEIALSKFCGPDCIITPITQQDEHLRFSLGYRGAQNYIDYNWTADKVQTRGKFYNHMPALEIANAIPKRVWIDYTKITIVRNPFDCAISRYFWEGGEKLNLSFLEYLKNNAEHLRDNYRIIGLEKGAILDGYLKYEDMEASLSNFGLGDVYEIYKSIRAKGDRRPQRGATINELYTKYPAAIKIVSDCCGSEFEAFGYPRQL